MPEGRVRYWLKLRRKAAGQEYGPLLTYLELMEVSVVAGFKEAGLPLRKIRAAHDYLSQLLRTPYPFAAQQLKTEGTHIIAEMPESKRLETGLGQLLIADKRGQIAWEAVILGRYAQFVYETEIAFPVRWYPRGQNVPVVIDPRIHFGQPTIDDIPTWAIADRVRAGEDLQFVADDYELSVEKVRIALEFEEVAA